MRASRRNDLSPRIELLPMIDVIFLLLTFFIYSMVIMVNARVLPVSLTPLAISQVSPPSEIQAVTINRDGKLFFNREQVNITTLDRRLAEISKNPNPPTLYLAVEERGNVDRGPLLLQILDRVIGTGIRDFALVGPPEDSGAAHGSGS